MPTDIFFALGQEKRSKIIDIAIAEFAEHGYANGSTNNIVRNAGISKGSLFKYFPSKDELYFYVLDCVTQELATSMAQQVHTLPQTLFERVIRYSELEFAWYITHPIKGKLITTAFRKDDSAIYQKVEARYKLQGQDIYRSLLEGIDTTPLRWNEGCADILQWFLKGFNEDFIMSIHTRNGADIDAQQYEHLRQSYVQRLTKYIEILRYGFIKKSEE